MSLNNSNVYSVVKATAVSAPTLTTGFPGPILALGAGANRWAMLARKASSGGEIYSSSANAVGAGSRRRTTAWDQLIEVEANLAILLNSGQQEDQLTGLFIGEWDGAAPLAAGQTIGLANTTTSPFLFFGCAHDYDHQFEARCWAPGQAAERFLVPATQNFFTAPATRKGNGVGIYGMIDSMVRRLKMRLDASNHRLTCWVDGVVALDVELSNTYTDNGVTILSPVELIGGAYCQNGAGTSGMTVGLTWNTSDPRTFVPDNPTTAKRVKLSTNLQTGTTPNTGIPANCLVSDVNRSTGVLTSGSDVTSSSTGTLTFDATCTTSMHVLALQVDVVRPETGLAY